MIATAQAQETWVGGGANEWNVPANWSPATVPPASGTATFGATGTKTINVSDYDAQIGTLDFTAPGYTLNLTSTTAQRTFTVTTIAGSAANAPTIILHDPGDGTNYGTLAFVGAGDAGYAKITNSPGSFGGVTFAGTSTAHASTIQNVYSVDFSDSSTADVATISATVITFSGSATAAQATISGVIQFSGNASGGTARAIVPGTQDGFDISGITPPSMTIGSLEGDGSDPASSGLGVTLGSKNLITGGNGRDATLLGPIMDGNPGGGGATGGSITKVGAGIWTLAGDSTYTGGTRIEGGGIVLGNGGATGSILGDVVMTSTGGPAKSFLGFNRSDQALVVDGQISGDGQVRQMGSGKTTLTNINNSYSDGSFISGGTLSISSAGNLGTGGLSFDTDPNQPNLTRTLQTTGSAPITFGQAVALNANGTIDTGANLTITDGITGAGSLTKTGAADLYLSGANTFLGGTTVDQGIAHATSAGSAFGKGLLTVVANATADLANFDTTAGGLAGAGTVTLGSGSLTLNQNLSTIFSGDVTGTGPFNLDAGSLQLDGTIGQTGAPVGAVAVASGTTLSGVGFVTANDITNAGTLSPGHGGPSGALTLSGAYTSNGGKLAIRTALGDSSFPTSQLVLTGQGTTAGGSTTIAVTNMSPGGAGAMTSGYGIQVVEAQNGATTGTGSFTLGSNIVAAGPYEYWLYRGSQFGATGADANNWYLNSAVLLPPLGPPPACTGPQCSPPPVCTNPNGCGGNGGNGGNGGPAPTPIPLYRPEAPVYAAAPGMARQLGMTLLGTFHERAGDQSLLRGSGPVPGAWGRWIGQKTEMSHGGPLSPKFDGTTNGLQIGLDLYGFDQPGYGSDRFGIFGGYARSLGDIDGFALGRQGYKAGKMDLSGYSIGGTWTHVGPGGWYIDAVLMGASYDGDPRSHRGQSAKVKGYGLTASLESGYPLALGRGLTLEPQAQIVWQYLKLDNTYDRFATIAYDTPSTLSGRLGLRLSGAFQAGSTVLKPYVTANIWQEFAGSDKTIFSGTALRSGGGNSTSAELTGGIATQVTNAVGLWGDVSYLTDIAGPDRQAWRGNVGVRVTW